MSDATHHNGPLLNAVCPFCSLLCEDIRVAVDGQALTLAEPVCEHAKAGFTDGSPEDFALVAGVQTSTQQAIEHASALLAGSRYPVFGGLATDIDGVRAIMLLADRCGGAVDHMDGDGLAHKNALLATRGAIMATLAEVANRADLIVTLGEAPLSASSRFLERAVNPADSLHPERLAARELVAIAPRTASRAIKQASVPATHLAAPLESLAEVLSALRALLAGRPLATRTVAGIKLADLARLAERLRSARYSVFAWGGDVSASAHAEVALELLHELLKDLNRKTRAAGFSLGGGNGAASANAVCGWQSGYGLRTSFAPGHPVHDPARFSARQLIGDGTADLLVWVSAFSTTRVPPPEFDCPTIVLGRSGMRFDVVPDVYIPVGTPGIDHPGRMVRADSTVSLPLPALRDSGLPSVQQVIGQIAALTLP